MFRSEVLRLITEQSVQVASQDQTGHMPDSVQSTLWLGGQRTFCTKVYETLSILNSFTPKDRTSGQVLA